MKELLQVEETMKVWVFWVLIIGTVLVSVTGTLLALHYLTDYNALGLIKNWCGCSIGLVMLFLPAILREKLTIK